MSAITDLHAQLLRDEGCRLHPYKDQVGKLTIGVGRCLDTKGISQGEADILLANDIRDAASDVQAELPWSYQLDDVRRAVLVNMAFNLGIKGLLGFKHMLAYVQQGQWELAAAEMLNSTWHGQVGIRAERLAEQMRSGQWQ